MKAEIRGAIVGLATFYPVAELTRIILFFMAEAYYPEHPGYAPSWVYWAELIGLWIGWAIAILVSWRMKD